MSLRGPRRKGPSFEEIVDLAEGRLSPENSARVQAQLDRDPTAAARFQWVRGLLAAGEHSVVEDPSPELHVRLVAMSALLPAKPPTPLDRIAAALRFDSWATPAPAPAMRHAGLGARHRHLVFGGGDVEVAIDVFEGSPDHQIEEVLGQVLTDQADPESIVVIITDDGKRTAIAVSDTGEFSAPMPASSNLTLDVVVGDRTFSIGPIDLSDPST